MIDVRATYGTDAAAIQAAYAALPVRDGIPVGELYLSEGEYDLGATGVYLAGRVALRGDGAGTLIRYTGAGCAIGVNTETPGVGTQGFGIRDLMVDCSGLGAECIRLGQLGAGSKSAGGTIERVILTGATGAALRCRGAQHLQCRSVRFDDNVGDGAHLGEEASNNAITFDGCRWRRNRRGLVVLNGSGILISGGAFEQQSEEAFLAVRDSGFGWVGSARVHMINVWFEGNCTSHPDAPDAYQLRFDALDGAASEPGTPGAHVLDNCFFSGGGGQHLHFKGGRFWVRAPRLVAPNNTSSCVAPDCAPGETLIRWEDWRSYGYTWHATDIGTNVVIKGVDLGA